MKLYVLIIAVILSLVLVGCESTSEKKETKGTTVIGYKVQGDKILFTYNPADYPAGFDEVEMVTVAGEFNGWDAGAKDWQAKKAGDGIWYFESTKDKAKSGMKFKFVVNTVDWQQPDTTKVPKDHLTDDGYGGFNLILIY